MIIMEKIMKQEYGLKMPAVVSRCWVSTAQCSPIASKQISPHVGEILWTNTLIIHLPTAPESIKDIHLIDDVELFICDSSTKGCGNRDFWRFCECKMITTAVSAAFENTMEEAFSALHCPNCEEFRRLRDFSQGRPAVKLSEVGNRQGGNQEPKKEPLMPSLPLVAWQAHWV